MEKIEDLGGRTLSSVKGYASTQLLKQHFPAIRTVEVASPMDGLKMVVYGKADAYLGTCRSKIGLDILIAVDLQNAYPVSLFNAQFNKRIS